MSNVDWAEHTFHKDFSSQITEIEIEIEIEINYSKKSLQFTLCMAARSAASNPDSQKAHSQFVEFLPLAQQRTHSKNKRWVNYWLISNL